MTAQVLHRTCIGATYARVQGVPYRDTCCAALRACARNALSVHRSLHTSVQGASS